MGESPDMSTKGTSGHDLRSAIVIFSSFDFKMLLVKNVANSLRGGHFIVLCVLWYRINAEHSWGH